MEAWLTVQKMFGRKVPEANDTSESETLNAGNALLLLTKSSQISTEQNSRGENDPSVKTGSNPTLVPGNEVKSDLKATTFKDEIAEGKGSKGKSLISGIASTITSGTTFGLEAKHQLIANTDVEGESLLSDPVVTLIKRPRGRPKKYPSTPAKDITIIPAVVTGETDKYLSTPTVIPVVTKQHGDLQENQVKGPGR